MSESDLVYTDYSKYNLFQGIGYKVEKVEGIFYKFTEIKNPYKYAESDECPKIPIYVPIGEMIHLSGHEKIMSRFPPKPSRMIAGKRRKPTHKQSKNTRRRSRKN